MKTIAVALAILATAAATPSFGTTSADSTKTRTTVPEAIEGGLLSPELGRPDHFLRDRYSYPTTGYLTVALGPRTMQWYRPPTRFDAILRDAGTAVTVGMFLGALGNTFGAFDETTTWILTGSLAAAGALAGGMTYEAEPTLRFHWDKR